METKWGLEIVGKEVVREDGAFVRTRYWLRGHHYNFGFYAKYIQGLTGPETVVLVDTIKPSVKVTME
jgi:hypothetical protein